MAEEFTHLLIALQINQNKYAVRPVCHASASRILPFNGVPIQLVPSGEMLAFFHGAFSCVILPIADATFSVFVMRKHFVFLTLMPAFAAFFTNHSDGCCATNNFVFHSSEIFFGSAILTNVFVGVCVCVCV